jgi:uridine phosphorylase
MAIIVQHINACEADIQGNGPIGRYFFLTGSDGRAHQISEMFINREEKRHPRQHNLYLGQLKNAHGQLVDVAAISTGMGGPSADIILNELVMLGAKRFLRIGTAGSLQTNHVKIGDLVVATGAVRDDKATWDYIYPEYPAIASYEYITASKKVSEKQLFNDRAVHFGVVHSKSSLFARQYQYSLIPQNADYMEAIRRSGVLASEMECAQFFILGPILTAKKTNRFSPLETIYCGAILAIIGDESGFASDRQVIIKASEKAIEFALETTFHLYEMDKALIDN